MKNNEKIFKKGSTTYYYSSLFFPKHVKDDVTKLYAYVRTMDDYVDNTEPKIKKLKSMWSLTKKAWIGKRVNNTIVKDFIFVAKKYKFEWEWIEAFYNAMKKDLTKKKYRNFSELEQYMYGSAEVIGLMMARILNLPKKTHETAMLQGKAMQLLNFIRDIKEDNALGRAYLQPPKNIDWEAYIRKEIDRYYTIQKEAAMGYAYIPKRFLVPIKTAADMYLWTAKRIYKNPSIIFEKKLKPSKSRILFHLIKNALLLK
jgi:phytoene synthase